MECARRLVLLDRAIEYLVELLSESTSSLLHLKVFKKKLDIEMTEGERAAAQQELMDFLYANNNGVKTEVLIDMDQLNSFSNSCPFPHKPPLPQGLTMLF